MIALEQQVNLFQPIFRAERTLFSTTFIAGFLGVTTALLVLLWAFAWRQVIRLEHEVATVEAARLERSDALRRVGAGFASDPASVAARAKELAAGIERTERTLALIRQGVVGSTTGFSARLHALARPEVPGLWLTRIALTGRDAAFAGMTQDAAAIPRYLQALAGDPAFATLRVDSFRADQDRDRGSGIAFVAGDGDLFTDEERGGRRARSGDPR